MTSESCDQVFVFRTSRRAWAVVDLAVSVLLLALAIVRTVRRHGSGDLVVDALSLLLFGACSAFYVWILVARPPLVIVDADGLRARIGPLTRFPPPLPWDAIAGFEIVRHRLVPLTRRVRMLGVQVCDPADPRWAASAPRRNVARFGTPYLILDRFLDGGLEQIVDAARTFKDLPLTYPDAQPRRWSTRR